MFLQNRAEAVSGFFILPPIRLIGVDAVGVSQHLHQIPVDLVPVSPRFLLKPLKACGYEIDSEKRGHHGRDFAEGKVEFMAQIERGGFGVEADGRVQENAPVLTAHVFLTAGTPCGPMPVFGGHPLGTKHDILLDKTQLILTGEVGRFATAGAVLRRIHLDDPINVLRDIPSPRGMAHGGPARFFTDVPVF